MIEQIIIQNYKSIKSLKLPLRQINVLVGSNGAGKSNFISFFEMTKAIYEQNLGGFTFSKGGVDNLLYKGRNVTDKIAGMFDFDNDKAFYYHLKPSLSSKAYIEEIGDYSNNNKSTDKQYDANWDKVVWERNIEESHLFYSNKYKNDYLKDNNFTIYHFHDTSSTSPMRGASNINDNLYLKHNGSNLAAFLYMLSLNDKSTFNFIEATIRSIAPYFKRFNLRENPNIAGSIQLEWEENNSDIYLNGYSFSDGTLRFIALATVLLQTNPPKIIIIDEPELGLHPAAINKFAALIKRASLSSQIIISTQSTNIVNCFDADDIITVDREDEQSIFKPLSDRTDLTIWLDEYNYSLSDLWEKNIIGGQL